MTSTTWRGSMTIKDIWLLERTFVTLGPDGWVSPPWLVSLRRKVLLVNGLQGI